MDVFAPNKGILPVFALAILFGCAPNMIYLRTDGQNISGDPAVHQLFDTDRAACQGKLQAADLSDVKFTQRGQAANQVVEGCMSERSYVLVREDQAAAKRQEIISALAAEKAKREAEAAEALAPPLPPPRRTKAVKPKPLQPVPHPSPN